MKNKLLFTFLFSVLLTAFSFAQTRRTIGLTGTLQGSQVGILLPVWVSNNISIAPAFSFVFSSGAGSEITAGLIPRYYFNTKKLSPYVGLTAGVIINHNISGTADQKNTFDIVTGGSFGAEYFFSNNFSVGVEAQGNFTISDKDSNKFGNPGGVNFNTATMVSATVYF